MALYVQLNVWPVTLTLTLTLIGAIFATEYVTFYWCLIFSYAWPFTGCVTLSSNQKEFNMQLAETETVFLELQVKIKELIV